MPPHDTAIPRPSSITEASDPAPMGAQIPSDTPSTHRRPVARAVAQASTSVVTDLYTNDSPGDRSRSVKPITASWIPTGPSHVRGTGENAMATP